MKDLAEAVKTAIDMEKRGYDLYMSAASKTSNKLGRSTLEAIAAKELNHIKAIEQFNETVSHKGSNINKAIEDINVKDKKDYIRTIMENLRKNLEEKVKVDSDLEKAYEVAMKLERESYDFYKKLHNEEGEQQVKEFFKFLMKEENTHYELLQETLQYLNKPGDWFKEQERWIVEG